MEVVEQPSGGPAAWDEAVAAFHARFVPFFYRREVPRGESAWARVLRRRSHDVGLRRTTY